MWIHSFIQTLAVVSDLELPYGLGCGFIDISYVESSLEKTLKGMSQGE